MMANVSPEPVTATVPAQSAPADRDVIDIRDSTLQLRSVKRHRSELKRSMTALEAVLARPVGADAGAWLDAVRHRVADLHDAFDNHIRVHEGPDSFHADIVRSQPHLTPHVVSLQRDHHRLSVQLMGLNDIIERHTSPRDIAFDVRSRGIDLIHQFARHRQKGADVVWEAFNFDVGGEH